MDPNAVRDDLVELQRRRELTEDAARPEAVSKRHDRGGRTARQNVADLIDEGSWVEYGRYATAQQRKRRSQEDLIANTPADGLVAGTATVDGHPTAVLAYDYTVLAGTQGTVGHFKKDRMFELIERMRLPVVFFAEGGGGRPGDTDHPVVSALQVRAFALWAKLSGHVPRIAIVAGNCFAGNAVIAGCSDLIIATKTASLGMAGPAMIAGGGLGDVRAEEIGPVEMQAPNGVLDLVVEDEEEAVATARRLLSHFHGPVGEWSAADQSALRGAVPENSRRAYDVMPIVRTIADEDSVTVLREPFAPRAGHRARAGRRTTRGHHRQQLQVEGGRGHGRCRGQGRAVHAALRRLRPADGLVDDTPGYMVGPEAERDALVRHCCRMLISGAALTVPTIAILLRRAYGLGAQAMAFGSLHEPLLTAAWPDATLGPMGLEGAVRLAMRRDLEAIEDEGEREQRVRELTAQMHEHAEALNAAQIFEIDDVIDPADTRATIARTLAAAGTAPPSRRTVDSW